MSAEIPSSHRALVVGPNKNWVIRNQALPQYDDLLVKVAFVSLNPTDWKHVENWGLGEGKSTGSDFAGTIVHAPNGSKYKVGDRVAGFTRGGALHADNGAFSEYISAQEPIVWKIPDDLKWEQAAAIGGIPGDTAAQALYTHLDIPRPWNTSATTAVKKGESILIWSGAASVSYYAIQLAALSGLKVFTTASPKHHDRLRALGASYVYDYKSPSVSEDIFRDSKGEIKIALDGISEEGSVSKVVKSLAQTGGKVVTLLPPSKEAKENYVKANYTVEGTLIYSVLEMKNKKDRDDIAEWHAQLPQMIADGKLKAHAIDLRQGGLEKIHEGLADLKDGKVSGKRLVYQI